MIDDERADWHLDDDAFYSRTLAQVTRRYSKKLSAAMPEERRKLRASLSAFSRDLDDYIERLSDDRNDDASFNVTPPSYNHHGSPDVVEPYRSFSYGETPTFRSSTMTLPSQGFQFEVGGFFESSALSLNSISSSRQCTEEIDHVSPEESDNPRPRKRTRNVTGRNSGLQRHKLAALNSGRPSSENTRDNQVLVTAQSAMTSEQIKTYLHRASRSTDTEVMPSHVRMVAAIASGHAFYQLYQILKSCNESATSQRHSAPNITADTLRLLDRLDTNSSANALLSRINLLRLHRHSKHLEQVVTEQRRRSRIHGLGDREDQSGSIKSLVIDQLYNEANKGNGTKPFSRDDLKRRLHQIVAWSTLCTAYSIGIIALVAMGEPYGISNSRIEKLSEETLRASLGLMREHRHEFLTRAAEHLSPWVESLMESGDLHGTFTFQDPNLETLLNEPMDAPRLLEVCATWSV